MKKILSILLILFTVLAYCKDKPAGQYLMTTESLNHNPNYISKNWKFIGGDDPAMASFTYNDRQWKEVKPSLEFSNNVKRPFKGIGWFRLHFIADTSVTGKPLAMTMTHFGASEIYIDGKLIKSFGTINGVDSSEY